MKKRFRNHANNGNRNLTCILFIYKWPIWKTYIYVWKKIIFNYFTFRILVTNLFKGHLISLTKIITLAKTLFILSPWNILLLKGHALILSEGPINYLMIFKIIYRKPKKFHVVFYEWTGRDLLLTVMNIFQVLMWILFQFCGLFP